MPLDHEIVERIVEEMLEAEAKRTLAPLVSSRYPRFTIDDAYRIQMKLMERKIEAGEKVVGKKVGLTSKIMQAKFGTNEPDFGFITDRMVIAEGEPIRLSELCCSSFEGAEIAFLMKEDLQGPGVNAATALEATAGVLPAIELTSRRLDHKDKFSLIDSIADNGDAGRFVLAGKITPVGDTDLRLVGMNVELNGQIVGTAAGAAALGNPAHVVAWLANKLAKLGTGLRAKDVVLTGTLVGGLRPCPGDVFKVNFDRLGSVTAIITN